MFVPVSDPATLPSIVMSIRCEAAVPPTAGSTAHPLTLSDSPVPPLNTVPPVAALTATSSTPKGWAQLPTSGPGHEFVRSRFPSHCG